ncbi:MAG: PorT family protein [Taibaiella sp.]|nr:PorT family protein [Taibaiella sp.]
MDNNLINIDDLMRQRLGGGEEQERSGAWLRMEQLLEKDERRKPLGFLYWKRAMSYGGLMVLLAAASLGGYEMTTAFRGSAGTAGGGALNDAAENGPLSNLTVAQKAAQATNSNYAIATGDGSHIGEAANTNKPTGNVNSENPDSKNGASLVTYSSTNGTTGANRNTSIKKYSSNTHHKPTAANQLANSIPNSKNNDKLQSADNQNNVNQNATAYVNSNVLRPSTVHTASVSSDASIIDAQKEGSNNTTVTTALGSGVAKTMSASRLTKSKTDVQNKATGNSRESSGATTNIVASTTADGVYLTNGKAAVNEKKSIRHITASSKHIAHVGTKANANSNATVAINTAKNTKHTTIKNTVNNATVTPPSAKVATGNSTKAIQSTDINNMPLSASANIGGSAASSPLTRKGHTTASTHTVKQKNVNSFNTNTTGQNVTNTVGVTEGGSTFDKHIAKHTASVTATRPGKHLNTNITAATRTSVALKGHKATPPLTTTTRTVSEDATDDLEINETAQQNNTTNTTSSGKSGTKNSALTNLSAASGSKSIALATVDEPTEKKVVRNIDVHQKTTGSYPGKVETQMDTISIDEVTIEGRRKAKAASSATDEVSVDLSELSSGNSIAGKANGNKGINSPAVSKTNKVAAPAKQTVEANITTTPAGKPLAAAPAPIVPNAAAPAAAAPAPVAAKPAEAIKKKKSKHFFESLSSAFNDLKYNINNVQVAPGLTAGINATFFGPNSFKGFQFGGTANFVFDNKWSVLTEVKYFHRMNNDYSMHTNYNSYEASNGGYLMTPKDRSFAFSTLHSFELPVSLRYTSGHFDFFGGANFLYTFRVNTGAADINADPQKAPVFVSQIGANSTPSLNETDFASRFGIGYLFGMSYRVAPNVMLDLRNVQTVWDNAKSTSAKNVSTELYKSPSIQFSIFYRLGHKEAE